MLKYMSYTIDTIQEQEQEAQVMVNVQCRMDIPGMVDLPLPLPVKEQWVRLDDGQWYRNMKPKKLGKTARPKGLNVCLTGCGIFIMVLSNHAARGKPKGTIDVRAGPERAT